ncbi:MAG: acylneuraminate cytidylyltransferase family protein [Candidatus Cloacimonetes bacterium]|nr:acylneuraminate cytidylyltransferase family protein [Candidatus Cloacimonadota bacterium]
MKKIITIIPARGGSKGLKNKNIIDVVGKPLIAWTIEQSIKTKSIYKTFVSTNDNQIADISKQYGAEIIWRPEDICGDSATSESAILHALDYLQKEQNVEPDYVVFLQATSPLRKQDDIEKAINKIIDDKADSLISGSRFEDFLFWEETNGKWESVNYDYKNRGTRQDRKPQFAENGSIYIFKPSVIRKYNNRISGKLSLYEMEFWQTWQIDTIEDIELIEFYMKKIGVKQQVNKILWKVY